MSYNLASLGTHLLFSLRLILSPFGPFVVKNGETVLQKLLLLTIF